MARQKRVFREWQHPRDGRGRFAKKGSPAWVAAASEKFRNAPSGLTAGTSGPGQPGGRRIARGAKAEALFAQHDASRTTRLAPFQPVQGPAAPPKKAVRPSTFELGARSKSASGADAPPLRKMAAPGAGRTRVSPAAKAAVKVDTSRDKAQAGGMTSTTKAETPALGADTAALKRPGARKGDLVVVERTSTSYNVNGPNTTKTDVVLGVVTSTDKNGKITSYSTHADGSYPRKVDHVREKTLKLEAERVDVPAAIEAAQANAWPTGQTGKPLDSLEQAKQVVKPFLGDQREKLKAARAAAPKSRAPLALKVGDVITVGGVSAEVTGAPEERREFGYRAARVRVPLRVLDGPNAGKDGAHTFSKSDKAQVTGSNRGANAMAGIVQNMAKVLDEIEAERKPKAATTRAQVPADTKRAVQASEGRAVTGVDMGDPNRWSGDKRYQFKQSAEYESNGYGGTNLLDDDRKAAFKKAISEFGNQPVWETAKLDAAARKIQVFRDENEALKADFTASRKRLAEAVAGRYGNEGEIVKAHIKALKRANGIPGDAAIKKLPDGQRALAEAIIFDAKNDARRRNAISNSKVNVEALTAELAGSNLTPRTRRETEKLLASVRSDAEAQPRESVADKLAVWHAVRAAAGDGDPGAKNYDFEVASGNGISQDQATELTVIGRRDGNALAERAAAHMRGEQPKPKGAIERASDTIAAQRGLDRIDTYGGQSTTTTLNPWAEAMQLPTKTLKDKGGRGREETDAERAATAARTAQATAGAEGAARNGRQSWDTLMSDRIADQRGLGKLTDEQLRNGITMRGNQTPEGKALQAELDRRTKTDIMADEPGPAAITSARENLAKADNPAADYGRNNRATNMALARQRGINVRGKDNDQLVAELKAHDEAGRAKRAAKLNPGNVGTPSTQHEQHTTLHENGASGDRVRPGTPTPVTEIRPGDRIASGPDDTPVTILSGPIETTDRFGRKMMRFQGRREDTGREGAIDFGPTGMAQRLPAAATDLQAKYEAFYNERSDGELARAAEIEGVSAVGKDRAALIQAVAAKRAAEDRAIETRNAVQNRIKDGGGTVRVSSVDRAITSGAERTGVSGAWKGGGISTFAQRMAGDMSQADRVAARAERDERTRQIRAQEAEDARQRAEAQANDTRTEREKLTDLLREQRTVDDIDRRSGRVDPKRVARTKAAETRLAELDTEDRKAKFKALGVQNGDRVKTDLGEFEVVGKTGDGYLRVVRPDGRKGAVDPKHVEGVTKAPKTDAPKAANSGEMSAEDLNAFMRSKGHDPTEGTPEQNREWLQRYEAAFGPVRVQAPNAASKAVQDLKAKIRSMELDKEAADLYGDSDGGDEDEQARAKKARQQELSDLRARLLDAERAERGFDKQRSKAYAKLSDAALDREIKNAKPGTRKLEALRDERDARAAERFRGSRPKADAAPVAASDVNAKRAANLDKARTVQRDMRREEIARSTEPKDNGSKIRALENGTVDTVSLYKTANAGPSGQRTHALVGKVEHTPDHPSGEFRIRGRDGEVTGWASRTVRNGEARYVIHSEGPNGEQRLEGWAGELATGVDVLNHGEFVARGYGADARRASSGTWENYAGRNMPLDELELNAARDQLRRAREHAANPDLAPIGRRSADRAVEVRQRQLDELLAERRAPELDTRRDSLQTGGVSNAPTTEANVTAKTTPAQTPYLTGRRVEVRVQNFDKPGFPMEWQAGTVDEHRLDGNGRIDMRAKLDKGGFAQRQIIGQRGGNKNVRPLAPTTEANVTKPLPKSKLAHGQDSMLRAIDAIEREIGPEPERPSGDRLVTYNSDEWNSPAEVTYREASKAWNRRVSEITQEVGSPHHVGYSGMHAQALQDKGLIEPYEYGKRTHPVLTAAGRKHLAETSPTPPPVKKAAPTGVVAQVGDRAPNGYTAPIPADRKERLDDKAFTDHVKMLTLVANTGDEARAWGFSTGEDRPLQVGDEVVVDTFDRLRRGIVTNVTRGGMGNARVAYATPTGGYVQETTAPHASVWQLVDPTKRPRENRAALLPPPTPEARGPRRMTDEERAASKAARQEAEKADAARRRQKFFDEKINGVTKALNGEPFSNTPEWHLQMTTEEGLVSLAKHLGVKVPNRAKDEFGRPESRDRDALRASIIDAVRARQQASTPKPAPGGDRDARHVTAPVSVDIFENGAGQLDVGPVNSRTVYDLHRDGGKWHAEHLEGPTVGGAALSADTLPNLARKVADRHGVSGAVSIQDEREGGRSLSQRFEHAAKPAAPVGERFTIPQVRAGEAGPEVRRFERDGVGATSLEDLKVVRDNERLPEAFRRQARSEINRRGAERSRTAAPTRLRDLPVGVTDAEAARAMPRIPGESDLAYQLRNAPSDDYAERVLNGYSVAGLKAIARDEKVAVRSGAAKPQLIEAINNQLRRRWHDAQATRGR